MHCFVLLVGTVSGFEPSPCCTIEHKHFLLICRIYKRKRKLSTKMPMSIASPMQKDRNFPPLPHQPVCSTKLKKKKKVIQHEFVCTFKTSILSTALSQVFFYSPSLTIKKKTKNKTHFKEVEKSKLKQKVKSLKTCLNLFFCD